MRKIIVVALLLVAAVAATLPMTKNRWFYENRRPTRLGKAVNRAWSWAASAGLTPKSWPGEPRIGTVTLEVRGRASGRPRSNVLTWVEQDGQRYLVSMLGERAEWVKNVHAAEGQAVIRHGRREKVLLDEVPVGERAPILKAYLKRTALSTGQHLGLDPQAPLVEFQRIAPVHPAFRIRKIDKESRKAAVR
jgi:deazaflavin-dependent oxidoreductase (nitroreductase family)